MVYVALKLNRFKLFAEHHLSTRGRSRPADVQMKVVPVCEVSLMKISLLLFLLLHLNPGNTSVSFCKPFCFALFNHSSHVVLIFKKL